MHARRNAQASTTLRRPCSAKREASERAALPPTPYPRCSGPPRAPRRKAPRGGNRCSEHARASQRPSPDDVAAPVQRKAGGAVRLHPKSPGPAPPASRSSGQRFPPRGAASHREKGNTRPRETPPTFHDFREVRTAAWGSAAPAGARGSRTLAALGCTRPQIRANRRGCEHVHIAAGSLNVYRGQRPAARNPRRHQRQGWLSCVTVGLVVLRCSTGILGDIVRR
jgi:hypothetical protein